MSISGITATVLSVMLGIGILMVGIPQYGVYSSRLAGEATLEKQKYEKQVAVQAAMAKKESAQLLADAEVIRSEGVAKANKIIGESLNGNEAYLRYLWINNMGENQKEVYYVPTEAGLPILEAGKRKDLK